MGNTQSTLNGPSGPSLLQRLRALKDAHPQCCVLEIEIMDEMADQKPTKTVIRKNDSTVVVRASCSSDLLEAFECQGFEGLILWVQQVSDLLNRGDQFWDQFCSVLKIYRFWTIVLRVGRPTSEAARKELMLDRPSYDLLGRCNSLVEAALANKSVQDLFLFSGCSDTDLDNVYLRESSSSSGYSAFQALLAPGHVSATTGRLRLVLRRWPLTANDVKILASDSPILRSLQLDSIHHSPAMTKKLVTLLRALEKNRTLRQLTFAESPASDVPEVYNAMIQLLERNSGTLRDVELACSCFELDERNADLRLRVDAVRQERKKCGNRFSGKTTLLRPMRPMSEVWESLVHP